MNFKSLMRTKPLEREPAAGPSLQTCLTAFDLTLLGIGAIIGAGVFVLTGVVAAVAAGPGVILSYLLAGSAALFAALSYAELAASVGGSGSAYHYAYVGFGEFIAWFIGWNLIFEYALSVATVAVGWAGYVNDVLISLNIQLPLGITQGPFGGGTLNLLAMLIVAVIAGLLCLGVRESARVNNIIVGLKLVTIAIFIAIASFNVHPSNWHPFLPFGLSGVVEGAALVFFAYIGFDALSTAAEETLNPQRDIPIGIIVSVLVCTTVYIVVAALLTGIVPYHSLDVSSPVAAALLQIGYPLAAGIVALGAIAGLTTVMIVMFYGLSRIVLAMARDGLLPQGLAKVHPRTRTPIPIILGSGALIALCAGLLPIDRAAELVNIGTLTAFTFVCLGVIYLRRKFPHLPRPFKLPWNPLLPGLGVLFCVYLMLNLPAITWLRFTLWLGVGISVYFFYSHGHSHLARRPQKQDFN